MKAATELAKQAKLEKQAKAETEKVKKTEAKPELSSKTPEVTFEIIKKQ